MSKKRNDFFLKNISETLNDGGIVILPSDNVYGIVAKYGIKSAKQRIYDLKKETFKKDLMFVVSTYKMLQQIADVDIRVINKLSVFFPGSISLVCKKKNTLEKITISMFKNDFINQIINLIKVPLLFVEASKDSEKLKSDPYVLYEEYEQEVDAIVMGPILKKIQSTIIDISEDKIKLVKKGIVDFDEIVKVFEVK